MLTATSSKYVWEPGGRPRFARRFPPVNDTDSGWCFLSGHDDESAPEFGDEPSNFRRNVLPELLAAFPELADILDAPVDSELAWSDDDARYHLALIT